MPARCNARASVRPPIPPPMMMTSTAVSRLDRPASDMIRQTLPVHNNTGAGRNCGLALGVEHVETGGVVCPLLRRPYARPVGRRLPMPKLDRVLETALYVDDLERAARFY